MNQLFATTQILPLARIRRRRVLSQPGQVFARAGQEVASTDLLAEAQIKPEFILIDIAEELGVPAKKVKEFVCREIGEEVSKETILAERPGRKRVVRATEAGTIASIRNGKLLLLVRSKTQKLYAGIKGVVTEIIPDYGCQIEATAALIQGAWGNNKVGGGKLINLAKTPEHSLSLEDLKQDIEDAVVLAGYCGEKSLLEACAVEPVAGLVLASMDAPLIPTALKMAYPILVLEGFGQIPFNPPAYKLLSTSAHREVSLYTFEASRLENTRPELSIHLESSHVPSSPPATTVLEPGLDVRVLSAPFHGRVGKIETILEKPVQLPNGIKTMGLHIRFEDEKALVPLANIEVLG